MRSLSNPSKILPTVLGVVVLLAMTGAVQVRNETKQAQSLGGANGAADGRCCPDLYPWMVITSFALGLHGSNGSFPSNDIFNPS